MGPDRRTRAWSGARAIAAGAVVAVVAALTCGTAPVSADEAARAKIGEVLEVYGGRAALAKVHAYRAEGTLHSIMRDVDAHTVRVFARPNRLKVLIDYPGHPEARVVDGERGWRNEMGSPLEPAEGPMLDAMILQAARADVPWILAERESSARLIEPVEKDGVKLDGIEIPLERGLVFRAYVHPVTRRVVMSQGELSHGGMTTHFETMYSDFRQVSGLWFGFQEENWASGTHTGTTKIGKIVLDPPLKSDEFRPPTTAKTKGKGAS